MRSGIYKITCIPTGKFYIGSTVNLAQRRGHHFWELEKNRNHNIILQRSYNKYGEEAFEFEVLERCVIDQLLIREQYYIDTLKPQLNVRKRAEANYGVKRSDVVLRNKVLMKGNTNRRKTVLQLDPITSEIIAKFESAQLACKNIKVGKGMISAYIIRKRVYRGYRWCYEEDYKNVA